MLNSIATTPPADKGGFNSLREIIAAAYALATSPDANIFDVVEMIESAASSDGALPFDRASRRDAWNLVSDRAQQAFRAGRGDEEAAERAEMRAYRASRALFDRLPSDATLGDFVNALLRREPAVGEEYARTLANDSVAAWSAEPVAQRVFTSSDNPFEETRTLPPPRAVARWRKACAMQSGPSGGPGGLRLAAVEGQSLQPCAESIQIEETVDSNRSAEAFDLATEPGLLGDIARWSQTFAYRPVSEFAQPAALATLAALFGRRWATPTGLGLNLYIVAIAPTGGGKDALLGAPRTLLADAGFRYLLGPGDFSSDAAIEKSLRVRPSQLMPLDEFGKLAQAMMGRNAPSFAKLAAKSLLEIYPRSAPGSEWTGKARASDEHDAAAEPIHAPTLSLLGVSTPEGFFDGMSSATLDDGFLNRLTVVRAGNAGDRQRDPARLIPPAKLIDAIRDAYELSSPVGNLTGVTSRDPAAKPAMSFARWADDAAIDAIEQVERYEDEAADAGRRGVAGRAAEQVQKIATLRALAREPASPAVTASDVRWAFEMVRASINAIETGAQEMMAGSDFEALVQAVERAVTLAGAEGLKWSYLVRAKGVSKADDRLVEAAVKRLETAERVWRIGPGGKRLRIRRPDERVPV